MDSKFYYISPILMPIGNKSQFHRFESILVLALSPQKEIIAVQELKFPHTWQTYWKEIENSTNPSAINLIQTRSIDLEVSEIEKHLTNAFNYIMNKGYVFFGLLNLSGNTFDPEIVNETGLFRKIIPEFVDMHISYRNEKKYPHFSDRTITVQFLGLGEKYFEFDKLSLNQVAKMAQYFHGSFFGIVGVTQSTSGPSVLSFAILSQNITKEPKLDIPILDKKGRDNLKYLVKTKAFYPAAGFRLDYGLASFHSLTQWSALELLPNFQKSYQIFQKYHQSVIMEQENPIEQNTLVNVLDETIPIKIKHSTIPSPPKKSAMTDILKSLQSIRAEIRSIANAPVIDSNLPKPIDGVHPPPSPIPILPTPIAPLPIPPLISLETVETPQIIPPSESKLEQKAVLEKPSIPLAKPIVPELQKPVVPPTKTGQEVPSTVVSGETATEDLPDYDAILQQMKVKGINLSHSDGTPYNREELKEFLMKGPDDKSLEFESQPIAMELMSKEDIFRDLKISLDAMSKLDELATKDQAVNRIYYPPPTLISFANQEGMTIGGSTVVVSIGTGRNLYMIPELKRMQMWGKFYKDLEGNPQIEDFVAMEEKDIESSGELENILQKAFISIRKNNQIFMGIMEIEGNGFEKNIFDEFVIPWEEIEKLNQINIKRRKIIKYPEISKEKWIEIRYYGKQKDFLANNIRQGTLEIAEESVKDLRYSQGILIGVVCVDEEATYFFILGDNFDHLKDPNYKMSVDRATLDKMYDLIEKSTLTPVSWWKLKFGFAGFDMLFAWEEIKNGAMVKMITDNYHNYIAKLLETKRKEDLIKAKVEKEFPPN